MKLFRLTILPMVLLASCSQYHVDFQKSAKDFKKPTSPAGPWQGEWKSEVNGHKGPIWCLASPDPADKNVWIFRYRAGWGILKFGDYKHRVAAKLDAKGQLPLKGKMTLPNNFGTYKVDGTLTKEAFNVRFNGNGDKGTMILSRPPKKIK